MKIKIITVILMTFTVLAVIYSLITPPLEAGDESRHYAVVKYIADTGRLPVQDGGEAEIHWSHEGNQPPLYYSLAAGLTFWIETGGWDDVFWYNPHTTIGVPLRADNKNITIHPPDEKWQGSVLAVHLIRFLSIAMAVVTVFAAYRIALLLFKGDVWLSAGAAAVTAFNPMFIFISASVNNDNAVIMFVTLALWAMADKLDRRESLAGFRFPALLGLLIALGALSKLYALGLLPLAGLFFFWLAYRDTPSIFSRHFWRNFIAWNLTMAVVVIVVAGWFYLRNALLYNGDIFALQVMRDTAGQRDELPSLATIRAEFEGFRIAYWALFGGVNILVDNWIYTVLNWVSLVAILGFVIYNPLLILKVISSDKNKDNSISSPVFVLLLGWCLIMLSGFIVWNLTQPAGQGRLFYPAISAISAFGILGLTWWLPAWRQKTVVGLCIAGLFSFALLAPFLYIAPAYAKPPILTGSDLPADLQPVNFIYEEKVRLIGYKLYADTVRPAQTLPLTLYWEILQPLDLNYSIFVHLLGRQRESVGQIDTYPGGGKWPFTLLSSGDILADYYTVPISADAEIRHAPTRLNIAAGIYDKNEPGMPGRPAVNSAGQVVEPVIASVKLIPWEWPSLPLTDSAVNFFDMVTLMSYKIADNQQSVTLNWQVNQDFNTDYTVFIQAWRADNNIYAAGFDSPPVQGDYPSTLWEQGEVIVDVHPLDLSALTPGSYYLLAGLYDPVSGERLPAFDSSGSVLPDYAVNLGEVEIRR